MTRFQRLAGRVTSTTQSQLVDGDMWINTSTNRLHRYNGSATLGIQLTTTSTSTTTTTSTSTSTTTTT